MKNHKEEAPVFACFCFSPYNWNALICLFFTFKSSENIWAFSLGCISLRSEEKESFFISYSDTAWGHFPLPASNPKHTHTIRSLAQNLSPPMSAPGSELHLSSWRKKSLRLIPQEGDQAMKSTDWGQEGEFWPWGNKGYLTLLNSFHSETQPVFKQHAAASGKLSGLENQTEGCLGSLRSSREARKTEFTLRR